MKSFEGIQPYTHKITEYTESHYQDGWIKIVKIKNHSGKQEARRKVIFFLSVAKKIRWFVPNDNDNDSQPVSEIRVSLFAQKIVSFQLNIDKITEIIQNYEKHYWEWN